MELGIIGYGAVAAIHARRLASASVTRAVVIGPDLDAARRFARAHAFAEATSDLDEALAGVQAVIVCSPSHLHYQQASTCLRRGVATLVELPPCARGKEAATLGADAARAGALLRCAHTSRYLLPYARVKEALEMNRLGAIQQITYVRHHTPINRRWVDDALLHHAAHAIDLLLDWFGETVPLGCVVSPPRGAPRSASILARVPRSVGAAICITYASRLPHGRLLVVGDRHTIETDGFSYVRCDDPALELKAEGQEVYERAIEDQDLDFIRAARGEAAGPDWNETTRLVEILDELRRLSSVGSTRRGDER